MRYRNSGVGRLFVAALAMFLPTERGAAEPLGEGKFHVRYAFSLGGKLLSYAEVACDYGKTCLLFTDQKGVELSLRPDRDGEGGALMVSCGDTHCGFASPAIWSTDNSRLEEFVVVERSPSDFGQELVIQIRRRIGSILLKFPPTESPVIVQPDIKL